MKRVNARLVQKYLNLWAKKIIDNVADYPAFNIRIITGDETWVKEYVVEIVQ